MKNAAQRSVYVIRSASGPVKIGIAAAPQDRIRDLQCANSQKLDLAHVHSTSEGLDAAAIERAAHVLLAGERQQGEWFDVSVDDAVAAIELAVEMVREGRQPKPEDGRRYNGFVAQRLPVELIARIDHHAKAAGISRSEAIRRLLVTALD